ncbi:beta-1,4-N-acetylglucosaminyltransferase [Entomortierella parvispora]|uniref:UDP-N-acetylglucosamine transferase subunit ALG13 n=1 Tax=Entomortierella parvispora TaxID=205924 RepID=A0A9P3HHX2_9FUNG|nr:beta-1,4-N-acetylglucosaminyltransferase [Entomortierella parvispora]
MSSTSRTVFVTVGSTRFDKLIAAVSSQPILHLLHSLGYTHVTMQHGAGPAPTSAASSATAIGVDSYNYKPNLHQDMEEADLVISHAGSGSILEALRLHKKLIVVVNEELMHNHQLELGSALQEQKYLVCCTTDQLEKALSAKEYESLQPFPEPNPSVFANLLDRQLGL